MSGGTYVTFYYRWDKCLILLQVAQMSWWHKCHGGTYVTFYIRWDKSHLLAIGGTNVSFLVIGGTNVDLIEGGTNVGGTNVGGTFVSGKKVAASS
jgi:hypothetical protein